MWYTLSFPARMSLSFWKRMRPFSKKMMVFSKKMPVLLKKGHHLFIKDRHLFGERPHPFPKGQERPGRRGKDISHTYPENPVHTRKPHTKHLQQSFAKLLPLPPPFLLKPLRTGRFKGWWHHFFLGGKKGCHHHFHLFFTPERPIEGEKTGGGGRPNTGKRRRVRTDRNRKPERQNGA